MTDKDYIVFFGIVLYCALFGYLVANLFRVPSLIGFGLGMFFGPIGWILVGLYGIKMGVGVEDE